MAPKQKLIFIDTSGETMNQPVQFVERVDLQALHYILEKVNFKTLFKKKKGDGEDVAKVETAKFTKFAMEVLQQDNKVTRCYTFADRKQYGRLFSEGGLQGIKKSSGEL